MQFIVITRTLFFGREVLSLFIAYSQRILNPADIGLSFNVTKNTQTSFFLIAWIGFLKTNCFESSNKNSQTHSVLLSLKNKPFTCPEEAELYNSKEILLCWILCYVGLNENAVLAAKSALDMAPDKFKFLDIDLKWSGCSGYWWRKWNRRPEFKS